MPDPIQANPAAPAVEPPAAPAGGGQIEPGKGQPGGAATETFAIDGQTLTADQVREALKAKADYARFEPEFTRRSQILSNPDQLHEYARKTYPDRFPAAPTPAATPEEQQRTEALKVLKDLGVLTKEEAETLAQQKAEQLFAQREADQLVKAESEKLGKEWDGADGKPKFVLKDVATFALENGYPNLTSAFREMHYDALREYFASQKPKPKAPVIAGPGGGSAPVRKDKPVRLDDESFSEAFNEFFPE
jgi:hypothetical protein